MKSPLPYIITTILLGLSILTASIPVSVTAICCSSLLIVITCLSAIYLLVDLARGRANRSLIDLAAFLSGHVACLVWLFAVLFATIGVRDAGGKGDFWSALYLSVITWTTVGYGDVYPVPAARFVAAGEAILGYVVMGLLIAIFVATLQR